MPLTRPLANFAPHEFQHPELVNQDAADLLDMLRTKFGSPLVLTDDGRPAGDLPSGASTTSWHFKGQAFDLRIRDWTWERLWLFVQAVVQLETAARAMGRGGVELELVWSARDRHAHIAFTLDNRPSRLVVAAD